MFLRKFLWYVEKLSIFCWVCLKLFFYLVFHPRKIKDFFFPIFSSINEFYKDSYGGLKSFEETALFEKITRQPIFAQSDLFDRDSKVTRSMETHFLATLIKAVDPGTIFEIGTYNGFTTLHLAVNSRQFCRIYTLDLPPDYEMQQSGKCSYDDILVAQLSQKTVHNRFYKKHPLEGKITELFGDSATFDYIPYAGKIDLVFIDGNHSYEYVRKDTENAFRMLSDRGIIVWHDFDFIIHRDIFRYLKSLSKKYPIYSVPDTRFAIYDKSAF